MLGNRHDKETLHALYQQIQEICDDFDKMRREAEGIVEKSQMPDATLHLNDVLQSTESATHTILDVATHIGSIAQESTMGDEDKQRINDYVMQIYEACSFQDISGQRIKKVLGYLSNLEKSLKRLSDTAQGNSVESSDGNPLLSGPALTGHAPSQADIDAMFKEM